MALRVNIMEVLRAGSVAIGNEPGVLGGGKVLKFCFYSGQVTLHVGYPFFM